MPGALPKHGAKARGQDAELRAMGAAAASVEESLRAMQRAWISFRDASCLYEQAQWMPDPQTDPATCAFNGVTWQVVWDADRAAFVTQSGEAVMGVAVESFAWPRGSNIAALSEVLIAAGHLEPAAPCAWQAFAPRPVPRTMALQVLALIDPAAQAPTATGEVPDPVCGPYGVSTHGVRYFLTDLRWPERTIFVEEGQERPLFAPP